MIERYETLRAKVLNPHPSLPYGYSFFVNKGMLAWCYSDKPDNRMQLSSHSDYDKLSFSEEAAKPIVQILANMIINVQQEFNYAY